MYFLEHVTCFPDMQNIEFEKTDQKFIILLMKYLIYYNGVNLPPFQLLKSPSEGVISRWQRSTLGATKKSFGNPS